MTLTDKADDLLRKEAYSNLSERLKEGGKVGRCHLIDLLDAELQSADRYPIALQDLEAILMNGGLGAEEFADKLIERYLTNPRFEYLLEEEMAEIESTPPEYDRHYVEEPI